MRHVLCAPGGRSKVTSHQGEAGGLKLANRAEIMRRDFVVPISVFSMPRCLGSESPSSISTGFHVIVVFSFLDRDFCVGFCSWMLCGLSVMSGFAEWTWLVCECDTCGSVLFVFVVFCFVFSMLLLSWFC